MKAIGSAALAVCLLAGAHANAQTQEKSRTETTTKQTGPGSDFKMKTETVVGTVTAYEAGKKIKVSGPGDKSYSFDLDEGARVSGSIVVGQPAKVTFYKNADGREQVTVLSEATASAQAAATAPKIHSESTMKQTGPGPDVKVKSEMVVGTVKEYEAGKKLKVTGPKDKDYSFDLDENVAFKGPVAVGERVKVTFVKTDSGEKITAVEPYNARS